MTYNELHEILTKKGLSNMDFCRQTGISPQILTNAKNRGGHFSASTMDKMKSFLEVEIIDELSEQETEMIKIYRNLDEESKRQLVLMLAFLKDQENKK